VPIDKVVDAVPTVRTEGDVTIVPVLEEVLVVETKLVLKEEIHIRHRVETENVEVPVVLRRQRAVVERLDAEDRPLADEERTNEP
jgi:stress response protein YsnF